MSRPVLAQSMQPGKLHPAKIYMQIFANTAELLRFITFATIFQWWRVLGSKVQPGDRHTHRQWLDVGWVGLFSVTSQSTTRIKHQHQSRVQSLHRCLDKAIYPWFLDTGMIRLTWAVSSVCQLIKVTLSFWGIMRWTDREITNIDKIERRN